MIPRISLCILIREVAMMEPLVDNTNAKAMVTPGVPIFTVSRAIYAAELALVLTDVAPFSGGSCNVHGGRPGIPPAI